MADDVLAALLADLRIQNKTDDYLGNAFSKVSPVGIGDIIRYDHLYSRWLIWNGVRWRPDRTRAVYDLLRVRAQEWMGLLPEEAGESRKMLMPIFDTAKKESVLRGMSAREGIAMSGDEWDRDPYLVGFENGIANLQTGQFYEKPDPALLVSKSVGVDWDPDATAPLFEAFLGQIMGGDEEMVAYVKRLIGYSLLGLTSEQKFWVWVGKGSNGKGVLAKAISHALGEYAHMPADTLYMRTKFGAARSDAARPDLLKLQAVRFAWMSEPPGGQFNEEMLKAHTGEDSILARNLYAKAEQMASFLPTHKIVFLTNDPPRTDDVGVSMQRRVRLIHFEQDYSQNPDRTLKTRLEAEAQGILNLAIREAVAWLEQGLPEPEKVTRWSTAYIEENDPLGQFVAERCRIGAHYSSPASALWGTYEDWATKRGDEMMSQMGFGLAMARKFTKKHTRHGAVYAGVKALSAVELADRGDDE